MEPSEQYWSACYNANLWQIRHNLQNTAMRYRLPILLTSLVLGIAVLLTIKGRRPSVGTMTPQTPLALGIQPSATPDRPATRGPYPADAVGGLLTSSPPPTAHYPLPPAQALLEAAIRSVEGQRSISARIRQRAELFGHQLLGSGRYLEVRQAAVPLIRLELKIQVAEQITSLVEVCDGRFLWTYRKVLDSESLDYVDAVRASEALERAGAGSGRVGSGPVPGLGGLSRLLRGLAAAFQFTSAQQGRVGDLAVWKIEGGWRPELLLKLLPKQKDRIQEQRPVDLSRLSEHLPDRVVLLFGQEDLFPYRIDYCRDALPKQSRGEPPAAHTLVTIEFFEVACNVPIPAGQFVYNPGTGERADRTEEFLQ